MMYAIKRSLASEVLVNGGGSDEVTDTLELDVTGSSSLSGFTA